MKGMKIKKQIKLDRLVTALVKAYEFPREIVNDVKLTAQSDDAANYAVHTLAFVGYLGAIEIIPESVCDNEDNIYDFLSKKFHESYIEPNIDKLDGFYAEAFRRLYEDGPIVSLH